jgi:hypothetical protein
VKTQVEGIYDNPDAPLSYDSLWDPANHHADTWLRTSGGSWSRWTSASWGAYENHGYFKMKPWNGQIAFDGPSYAGIQYVYNYYDWMLRD